MHKTDWNCTKYGLAANNWDSQKNFSNSYPNFHKQPSTKKLTEKKSKMFNEKLTMLLLPSNSVWARTSQVKGSTLLSQTVDSWFPEDDWLHIHADVGAGMDAGAGIYCTLFTQYLSLNNYSSPLMETIRKTLSHLHLLGWQSFIIFWHKTCH